MKLSNSQLRFLRGLAHALKPVVLVGNKGVTAPLVAELDGALAHHELVKVRIDAADREARDAIVGELEKRAGATRCSASATC
jgi:RNA-binding protein